MIWLSSHLSWKNITLPGRNNHLYKRSHPEVFCKKGVLKNFLKFAGKQLCQSLFFNKVAGLRPETLLKKRLWRRYFPVNFEKFLRISFLENTTGDCFHLCLLAIVQSLSTCFTSPNTIKFLHV